MSTGSTQRLLEHFQDAALGRDRQREDDEIDAGAPGKAHEVVDCAELLPLADLRERALLAAVIEHAEHAHVAVALGGKGADQSIAARIRADDDGASIESALPRPLPHEQEHGAPERQQDDKPGGIEGAQPQARVVISYFAEEGEADDDEEDNRPRRGQPEILLLVTPERLHLIDIGGLEGEHGEKADAENGPDVAPLQPFDRNQIRHVDRQSDRHDQNEFDHAHDAGNHDRRPGGHNRLGEGADGIGGCVFGVGRGAALAMLCAALGRSCRCGGVQVEHGIRAKEKASRNG
jgi:hypothetical protein